MSISLEELNILLARPEGENLEFKEARSKFDRSYKLPDYCAALANERGGKLLLGVDDDGNVVGSSAFKGTHNKLGNELFNSLGIHVDIDEVLHPDGRVLVFNVPSRSIGRRIKSPGKFNYPIRRGESLVEMDDETTKRILTEAEPDFSASIISELSFADLDPAALELFRARWAKKSGREDYLSMSFEEGLHNLSLMVDDKLTYAALILLGNAKAISRYLPDAEIIFEWRQIPEKTPYDARKTWSEPFVLVFDEIWNALNERNLRFPYQEGFFQNDIWAFSEKVIREAVLNAVAHRDYSLKGHSIFITASPKAFCIESPGGFPYGVTAENILSQHVWRNRLLAEALSRIGLVERSGQGLNDIFEDTIKAGKGLPQIVERDSTSVELTVPAQVQDPAFVAYLEKVVNQKQILLSSSEIVALEKLRVAGKLAELDFKDKFLAEGIIERVGKTRGAKYILAHEYYAETSKRGQHTKLVGISREQRKQLIFNHIQKNGKGRTSEFCDAMPELSAKDIDNLLQELRRDGLIEFKGRGSSGYWVTK